MSCYLRTPAIVSFSVTNTSAYPVRNLRVEYNQQLEHFLHLMRKVARYCSKSSRHVIARYLR